MHARAPLFFRILGVSWPHAAHDEGDLFRNFYEALCGSPARVAEVLELSCDGSSKEFPMGDAVKGWIADLGAEAVAAAGGPREVWDSPAPHPDKWHAPDMASPLSAKYAAIRLARDTRLGSAQLGELQSPGGIADLMGSAGMLRYRLAVIEAKASPNLHPLALRAIGRAARDCEIERQSERLLASVLGVSPQP